MIEVEQAIDLLANAVAPQRETETVDILDATGRVTAADILSPLDVPRFARSAMDGYAVHAADIAFASKAAPARLAVLGELCAGDDKTFAAAPGTAVRIMTGAAVPPAYDCVVRQEDTDKGEGTVAVYAPAAPGRFIGEAGEDIKRGELAVAAYTRLTTRHIGVLASLGFATVSVLRQWRVGIIATGDEIAAPGGGLGPAQIYNSGSYTIAAEIKAAGAQLAFLRIAPDAPPAFCRLLEETVRDVDVIITTGAVSVGKKDFIPSALAFLGAKTLFHRVNMKPGTPALAALYKGKPVLCLSGNPFAALVNFSVFFWPMLAKAMHCDDFTWKRGRAAVAEGEMKESGQRRFVRAYKREDGVHLYTKNHRSSVISNLPASNCIIDQPAGLALREGSEVEILYWKF